MFSYTNGGSMETLDVNYLEVSDEVHLVEFPHGNSKV